MGKEASVANRLVVNDPKLIIERVVLAVISYCAQGD
jgi:hypothetical protein